MKFAFLIMGDFDCKIDNAQIGNGSAQIVGVSNLEEAVFAAKELYERLCHNKWLIFDEK